MECKVGKKLSCFFVVSNIFIYGVDLIECIIKEVFLDCIILYVVVFFYYILYLGGVC